MSKTKKAIALMRTSYKNKWYQRDDIFGQFNGMYTYAKKNNVDIAEAIECRPTIGGEGFSVTQLMSKAYNVCHFNPQVSYLLVSDVTRVGKDYKQYKYWEKVFKDKV